MKRKPNRLQKYDYSQNGYYFITICTKGRYKWFGEIKNDVMELNEFGDIAKKIWLEIPRHFGNIELDEFIIMPNHVQGIVIIVGGRHACPLQMKRQYQTLPEVIGSYKSAVTRYVHQIKNGQNFYWQRSFYDCIIRNELSLNRARGYIINNPKQWNMDVNNTAVGVRHA